MSNETELKSRDYSIPASLMADLLEVVENAQSDVNGLVPDAIALHAKLQLIVELKDRDNPKENPAKPAEYAGDKVFKEIQEKQKKFEEAIKKFERERQADEKKGPCPFTPITFPTYPSTDPYSIPALFYQPIIDPNRITCDSTAVSKAQQELINGAAATGKVDASWADFPPGGVHSSSKPVASAESI